MKDVSSEKRRCVKLKMIQNADMTYLVGTPISVSAEELAVPEGNGWRNTAQNNAMLHYRAGNDGYVTITTSIVLQTAVVW